MKKDKTVLRTGYIFSRELRKKIESIMLHEPNRVYNWDMLGHLVNAFKKRHGLVKPVRRFVKKGFYRSTPVNDCTKCSDFFDSEKDLENHYKSIHRTA